jgi:hypothetical protein
MSALLSSRLPKVCCKIFVASALKVDENFQSFLLLPQVLCTWAEYLQRHVGVDVALQTAWQELFLSCLTVFPVDDRHPVLIVSFICARVVHRV